MFPINWKVGFGRAVLIVFVFIYVVFFAFGIGKALKDIVTEYGTTTVKSDPRFSNITLTLVIPGVTTISTVHKRSVVLNFNYDLSLMPTPTMTAVPDITTTSILPSNYNLNASLNTNTTARPVIQPSFLHPITASALELPARRLQNLHTTTAIDVHSCSTSLPDPGQSDKELSVQFYSVLGMILAGLGVVAVAVLLVYIIVEITNKDVKLDWSGWRAWLRRFNKRRNNLTFPYNHLKHPENYNPDYACNNLSDPHNHNPVYPRNLYNTYPENYNQTILYPNTTPTVDPLVATPYLSDDSTIPTNKNHC